MSIIPKSLCLVFMFLSSFAIHSKDYYVHPGLGNDNSSGTSKSHAFKTLERAGQVNFVAGDRLFLASGQTYKGSLILRNLSGSENQPIMITSLSWEGNKNSTPALIDFKGLANGILVENCSFITISNINIRGNGYDTKPAEASMTCGVLVTSTDINDMTGIKLFNLNLHDIFHENKGFKRGKEEVRTANGTQEYGWGIRVINRNNQSLIRDILIADCTVKNVSHTGIKLTGKNQNILDFQILNNRVENTGGPGIQMSEVKFGYIANNYITHSGSDNDSRKWGRGSGLWTWGSSNVLIEKNKFLYANGPGDSAGAHIDYNCDNIVLQYNFSAYNAGGFCEILGNNYNCAYRYNISVNDGARKKGKDGAFQEGKIFWLSGYRGKKKRKGPVNTYFYNNTIYVDSTIVPKIAIDNSSDGILIMNNIFYTEENMKLVLGDQYKPAKENEELASNVIFQNNLFLNEKSWPQKIALQDISPLFGDPQFSNPGGLNIKDYLPQNKKLIFEKGMEIPYLKNDNFGLLQSLEVKKDILGKAIENPSLGAIVPE